MATKTRFLVPSPYPVWVTTSLPDTQGFAPYSQTLSVTSPASATPVYTIVAGSIPPGLTLTTAGTLSGSVTNPASNTTYSFTVRATTGIYFTDQSFSIAVATMVQTDPYATNVVFLYHADGNYTDAVQGRTMTIMNPNANYGVTSTNPKFGSGSLNFNASMTGSQDIRVPATSDLICTGDFTFEFWMYASSTQATPASNPVPLCTAVAAQGSALQLDSSVGPATYFTKSTGVYSVKWKNGTAGSFTGSLLDNTWHHYAFVRSANTIAHYKDGVLAFNINTSGNIDFGSQYGLKFGQWNNNTSANFFVGNIDEIRLTKAIRYSGNFTPPTDAFQYP